MGLPGFKETINQHLQNEITPNQLYIDNFPYYTEKNGWATLGNSGWDDWVSGFWPGISWLAVSADKKWLGRARKKTAQIKARLSNNFNIGFRYQYSWLAGYEITRDPTMKREAMGAAQRLQKCFNPRAGIICHRPNKTQLIAATDSLMNLPLLFWANQHSENSAPWEFILRSSLNRSRELFLRSDDSIRHLVKLEASTGKVISSQSPQGKKNGCWSRGLAWAVAGFVLGGLKFNDDSYLETADRLISYHRKNTDGLIPAYDYCIDLKEKPQLTDTSAAAIIAASLILLGIKRKDRSYFSLGKKITEKLFTDYLRDKDQPGLLGGSCFHYPSRAGINSATVWGDFYALEALYLLEKEKTPLYYNWLKSA
jgi:unsaturated chondroitin disaccharide hydrolase